MMKQNSEIFQTYVGIEYLANIGLPIFLFIISLSSFFWFFREVKKKRLAFRSMAAWFTLNIFYTVIIIYILIVSSLQIAGYKNAVNFFDWIARYAFGFELNAGKQYIFVLIFVFVSYILIRSLRNSIKIADMKSKVDALNKEVAILSGKINDTLKTNTKDNKTNSKTKRNNSIKGKQ